MTGSKVAPTQEQRTAVKRLAGLGLTQQQICSVAGIASPKVLRRHFGKELTRGPVETKAKVMQTAFRLASSGRNPAMTIFWLKTRGRWSEKNGLPPQEGRSSEVRGFVIEEFQPVRSPEDEMAIQAALAGLQTSGAGAGWDGDGASDDQEDSDGRYTGYV